MAVAFDITRLSSAGPARKTLLPAPEQLHERCARKIRRHVARVLGTDDDHEDLVQDVLLTAFLKLDTLRDPACFDAWVAQITTNMLRVAIRQRSMRRRAIGMYLAQHADDSAHTDVEALHDADRAIRLVGRLSPKERALLLAQWFTPGTGASVVASLAAQSGCSIVTMRRRLTRARARFEKLARRDPALAQRVSEGKASRRDERVKVRAPTNEQPPSRLGNDVRALKI